MRIKSLLHTLFNEGGIDFIKEFALFKLGHGKMRPRALNFAATSDCNLRCDICYHHRYLAYQRSKGKYPAKALSKKEWMEILQRYKENGTGSATVTGGESLLVPEIVDAAYNVFGNSCIIITNGTQPIDQKWRTRIFVSLHWATAEGQDAICGVPGTFDKIIENVKDDKRIVITAVLNHRNVSQIEPMVELTKKLGVRGIVFSGFTPGKRKPGQKPNPLTLTRQDDKLIATKLTKIWENNKDVVLMSPEIIRLFWTRKHQKGCSVRGGPEGSGWVLSLGSDGKPIDQCVMGENTDCNECKCVIPMQMEALKWAIPYALFNLDFDIIVRAVKAIRDAFTYEEPNL